MRLSLVITEIRKVLIGFSSIAIFGTTAFAGGADGGGGLSIVCRDADGKILESELVDINKWSYGKRMYLEDLKRVEATGDKEQDKVLLQQEFNKFFNLHIFKNPAFAAHKIILQDSVDYILEQIEYSLNKEELSLGGKYIYAQPDIGRGEAVVIPNDCKPEHVFYYQGNTRGTLLTNEEIWNSFDITTRLAGVLHEASYLNGRLLFGETESFETRKDVRNLMKLLVTDEPFYEERAPWMLSIRNYRRFVPTKYSNTTGINLKLDKGSSAKVILKFYRTFRSGKERQLLASKTVRLKGKDVFLMPIDMRDGRVWTEVDMHWENTWFSSEEKPSVGVEFYATEDDKKRLLNYVSLYAQDEKVATFFKIGNSNGAFERHTKWDDF